MLILRLKERKNVQLKYCISYRLSRIAKVFKNVQESKDDNCKIIFIKISSLGIDKYCFLALVPHIYRADHRYWPDNVHLQVIRLQHHWVLDGSFSKVSSYSADLKICRIRRRH